VGRPVPIEPTGCLLQLPCGTGCILVARVVPGDSDVNQALEEVALQVRRIAPLFFERVVRRVVLALGDQLETLLQGHGRSIAPARGRGSVADVATILLIGVDLFFRAKLEGLLVGHHLVTSDSADPPDLVFCDIARVVPADVAAAWPDAPIVGYTNHTDTAGLRAGHAAGFDHVIVKSALVKRGAALVAELLGENDG